MSAQADLRTVAVAAVTEPTVLCPDRIPQSVSRAQPVVAQSLSGEFRQASPLSALPDEAETDTSERGLSIGEVDAVQKTAPTNGPRTHGSRIPRIRFNHGKTVKNPYSRSVSIAYQRACDHAGPCSGEVSPKGGR